MNKKMVAIVQSCYIPWKGYFDLINMADEFIIYDTVQYTKGDWRNRNVIKTARGTEWLSIPVNVKGRSRQPINEMKVADANWAAKHWLAIQTNYGSAPYFNNFKESLKNMYIQAGRLEYLSEINYLFLNSICRWLDIRTPLTWSNHYENVQGKNENLIHLCRQSGAKKYLTGPAAKEYLNEKMFEEANIEVVWMDYGNYKPYDQLHGKFEHNVTVLDLLFNTGPNARHYLKTGYIEK